jgi:hypothetical protein
VGEVVVLGFSGLSVVALVLIVLGALRRSRPPILAGAALLFALAGAWIFGPPGALLGAVPLLFLRRR